MQKAYNGSNINNIIFFLRNLLLFGIAIVSGATRQQSTVNLIQNGNFDVINKQTGILVSWSCQGKGNSYLPMFRTMKFSKSESFAGLCTQRTNAGHGPSQDITRLVKGDSLYRLQGWTKLLNSRSRKELSEIQLSLRWRSESEEEEQKLLGLRNKFLPNHDWVYWNTQFHIADSSNFDYVILYFHGPAEHVDILIDDVWLETIPKLDNWRQHFDNMIGDVRTRDVTLRIEFPTNDFGEIELVTSATLEVNQVSSAFGFGVSVHHEAVKDDVNYRSFIENHFEWATMEHALKWPYIEKVQGKLDYTVSDEMLRILQDEMRMKVRGHCIFWAVPDEQPDWLSKGSPIQIQSSMRNRLHNILNRYKHRIQIWDVNNEMLHGSFYSDATNETIRNWMYYEARKIFPDGKMFVNEYEVLSAPWYTQSYIEQIQQFQRHGVRIDGIGVQGHFAGSVHPEILKERLDNLAVLGLPIWITELDAITEDDTKRADVIDKIMRIAYAHPAVHGIILWTFWDKHAWKKNTALFTGHNFQPNKAGQKYLELRDEWKTNFTTLRPADVSHNGCTFRFNAHHGVYSLKVSLPDGSLLSKTVKVLNHPGEVLFVFHTFRRAGK